MKKTITLSAITLCTGMLLMQSVTNDVHSNTSGSPQGRTGSPGDGITCATSNCHSTTATVSATPLISTNIPPSGYVPGQTYTVTVTMTQAGINRMGFQVSPQDASGNLLGTLTLTNPSTTRFAQNNSKYVTHTTTGSSTPGGTGTWSFNWTAPASTINSVTFYGAFNFANNNGQSGGDAIRTSTLTVNKSSVGIADEIENGRDMDMVIFPNPVQETAQIRIKLDTPEMLELNLVDLQGRLLAEPMLWQGVAGANDISVPGLAKLQTGIYRLIVKAGDKSAVETFYKD